MTTTRTLRMNGAFSSRRFAVSALLPIVGMMFATGCATMHRAQSSFPDAWDPGVEVRFPDSVARSDHPDQPEHQHDQAQTEVDTVAAPDYPMPPVHRVVRGTAAIGLWGIDQLGLTVVPRQLWGIPEHGDTKYTLIPGTYAFAYDDYDADTVWGAIHMYPVSTPRARDFIRHASIALTPGPGGGHSVLSDSELDRARRGDVITKVVFVADLAAIRDRIGKIDRGLREFERLRRSLEEQESYWARKVADRRLNTRYSADYGWGVDVPSGDLALLQALVGPERYHWHRFSEAEDQLSTYEAKLAELDAPVRRLRSEREALKHMLSGVHDIHRSDQLMVLTDDMIREFKDPVLEVEGLRGGNVWADDYRDKIMIEGDDWVGPFGKFHFPYWYSSLANGALSPGLRAVKAPSLAWTKNVGQVLLVIQVGSRRPAELGGDSWVASR